MKYNKKQKRQKSEVKHARKSHCGKTDQFLLLFMKYNVG